MKERDTMPGPIDYVRGFVRRLTSGRAQAPATVLEEFPDLPLRRAEVVPVAREGLTLSPTAGFVDSDDYAFRRISSGQRFARRDLDPMQQDRMLEIAWFIWEQNPFARRIVTAMTDLVVGEGLGFSAKDEAIQAAGDRVWNHPINKLAERARELHSALSVNGELILPAGVNPITGVPSIGYIDPYQVASVETRVDNVLVPEFVVLKKQPNEAEPRRLKVIQPDPVTGLLDGEVFYLGINKLPNSGRGRSDYLPLADWLDMFDQYMFAEIERVKLLGAFVWDLEIKDGNPESIRARVDEIGTPESGSMFGHNEKEKLEPKSPSLNAVDRTETARLLTIHIAGSMGMPITWFGWPDSTRATLDGQNDVAMKTPAARQKEFGQFLATIVRFGIERQRTLNPVLFRGVGDDTFSVDMPEIQAKDLGRAGTALASVVAALDTAMSNRTMSRTLATKIQLAIARHLGAFSETVQDVLDEADKDAEERQERQDELLATMAASRAAGAPGAPGPVPPPRGPGGKTNPPIDNGQD